MEKTCDYSICTGCGVCCEVCPKHCITFVTKEKGHLFPQINVSECIDCKKCERVCPALKNISAVKPENAFAAIAIDREDYLTTTSGGAAQIISKHIILKGGVVYGCAALPGVEIKHIRIDNVDDLNKLKGSKYVQSDMSGIFYSLKKDIEVGLPVLFIGVPCQVAAIKSLFNKQPENLMLVDLICHGVPSHKSLKNYLEKHISNISTIDDLKFRTSRGFQVVASKRRLGSQEKEILYESVPLADNPFGEEYYSPFFYGYSYRPSCYFCHYAKPQRISDITIGDFWGLDESSMPINFPPHKKGISLILPNTEQGARIKSEIEKYMHLAERPVEEAIEGNKQLQQPTTRTLKIKVYEFLSKYIGNNIAFRITNFDMPLRIFLRPYLKKLKNITK